MIAYDELAAALDRWRIRNGLPANPPLFGDTRAAAPPPPPPPAPRATQAIAAAPPPPPPPAAPAAPAPRTPPPPPSGRATLFGMPAPTVVAPPPAAPITATAAVVAAPPDGGDLGEAEVLEESGDVYDNEGNDFAVEFGKTAAGAIGDHDEATRVGGDAASSADGWPEARTMATHGWGQAPAKPAVEADDEATHIGDPARRN